MAPRSSAFYVPPPVLHFSRSFPPSCFYRRPSKCNVPPQASLRPPPTEFPVGSIIAAGVSVGILSATFENILNALYKCPGHPSDDELCAFCSGFGNVRCEICVSRGVVAILGTSVLRECPVCKGKKYERCRRCAGTGKSGMKKSQTSASDVDR